MRRGWQARYKFSPYRFQPGDKVAWDGFYGERTGVIVAPTHGDPMSAYVRVELGSNAMYFVDARITRLRHVDG